MNTNNYYPTKEVPEPPIIEEQSFISVQRSEWDRVRNDYYNILKNNKYSNIDKSIEYRIILNGTKVYHGSELKKYHTHITSLMPPTLQRAEIWIYEKPNHKHYRQREEIRFKIEDDYQQNRENQVESQMQGLLGVDKLGSNTFQEAIDRRTEVEVTKIENGKLKELKEKHEALLEKYDGIIEEQNKTIKKYEDDVYKLNRELSDLKQKDPSHINNIVGLAGTVIAQQLASRGMQNLGLAGIMPEPNTATKPEQTQEVEESHQEALEFYQYFYQLFGEESSYVMGFLEKLSLHRRHLLSDVQAFIEAGKPLSEYALIPQEDNL